MLPAIKPNRFSRRKIATKIVRDIQNKWRFGADGPLSDEALFVDPCGVKWQFTPDADAECFDKNTSGLVASGDWDRCVGDVTKTPKYIACHAHFLEGQPWEQTGIYDHMMQLIAKHGSFDECYTMDDVIARYASIDRLYDKLSKQNRLKLRRDLPSHYRREYGGIFAHINRHGEPLRFANGNHRFLIARILKFPEVPIHVGGVHLDAVTNGAFASLRRSIYD